ncbi:unnamed protein product, partial [Ectocarpus sp. 4 AP-2014]
ISTTAPSLPCWRMVSPPTRRPASSLAREDTRHLKVEECDEFFGLNRDKPSPNANIVKSVFCSSHVLRGVFPLYP